MLSVKLSVCRIWSTMPERLQPEAETVSYSRHCSNKVLPTSDSLQAHFLEFYHLIESISRSFSAAIQIWKASVGNVSASNDWTSRADSNGKASMPSGPPSGSKRNASMRHGPVGQTSDRDAEDDPQQTTAISSAEMMPSRQWLACPYLKYDADRYVKNGPRSIELSACCHCRLGSIASLK